MEKFGYIRKVQWRSLGRFTGFGNEIGNLANQRAPPHLVGYLEERRVGVGAHGVREEAQRRFRVAALYRRSRTQRHRQRADLPPPPIRVQPMKLAASVIRIYHSLYHVQS